MIATDSTMVRPSSSEYRHASKAAFGAESRIAGRALGQIEGDALKGNAKLRQQDAHLPGIAGQPAIVETQHDGLRLS